jgi:hypothetical protein
MHQPSESGLVCSACGAVRPDRVSRCWLCRREVQAIDCPPVRAAAAEPIANRQPMSFSLATLMTVVAVVAVGFGLANWNISYAISYAMLVVVPLIAVAVRELHNRSGGREVTWSQRIATFFISIVIIQALAAALVVAGAIALCLACFATFARGSGS